MGYKKEFEIGGETMNKLDLRRRYHELAFVFDTDVPMPEFGLPRRDLGRRGARSKYPLGEMEVGWSFFMEGRTAQQMGPVMARYRPKRFVARERVEVDKESGLSVEGVRVWRVE